jgi:hypothetical protein
MDPPPIDDFDAADVEVAAGIVAEADLVGIPFRGLKKDLFKSNHTRLAH